MPHLKVKPFHEDVILKGMAESDLITFFAKSLTGLEAILGISYKAEEFLLQLKPDGDRMLLKYDKVTRPLKVNLLKEALAKVSVLLELEVLSSNITISKTAPALASEAFKKIEDFEDMVYPKERVCVEVGFGSGRHLLYQAVENPEVLFIGLEIHTPSAQQLLKQIALQKLTNIWVVNYDARLFLEMLPSNLCEKIFVHFPVPWDKKPYRRVISQGFLDASMRVLHKGGRLELRTDSHRYFWYALETFCAVDRSSMEIRKNKALAVTSKYEARWKRQNKDIYDVCVLATEHTEERMLTVDFNFNIVKYKDNLEERLPKETVVFDGYFVHFERIYKDRANRLLIKCAFGSFDRPEHKYIVLDAKGCRYFVSNPVKSAVNAQAHKNIVAFLQEE